jgi:3-oxoacyl-[acyl-carrier protein] reductase
MNNRTALVTGGSRGIGRAACIALAERGVAVAVHYRAQAEAADEVVSEIQHSGGKAFAIQADMANASDIQRLMHRVNASLGPIDILVNNAGEMTDGAVIDMSDDMWEQTLSVNLSAVFRCSRACIAAMKERQWGRIINLTSQAAYTGSANHAHYAASKSGLLGLTYSLAKELGTAGITVNLVAPGRITTDMVLDRMEGREEEWMRQTPLKRLGRPEEVAAAIAFLASEDASYITGATLHVNGGLLMS